MDSQNEQFGDIPFHKPLYFPEPHHNQRRRNEWEKWDRLRLPVRQVGSWSLLRNPASSLSQQQSQTESCSPLGSPTTANVIGPHWQQQQQQQPNTANDGGVSTFRYDTCERQCHVGCMLLNKEYIIHNRHLSHCYPATLVA